MQWASSIATKAILASLNSFLQGSAIAVSGDMKTEARVSHATSTFVQVDIEACMHMYLKCMHGCMQRAYEI